MYDLPDRIAQAVKEYTDGTARKHKCAGFDCKVCALNGDRYIEVRDKIAEALKER